MTLPSVSTLLMPAPTFSDVDYRWMQRALAQAHTAAQQGEVPVGAVLLGPDGVMLAETANAPIALHDPTAHAEIRALRTGAMALGNYRLPSCTLYVTLEPCPMCLSAIAAARVSRLVYGASDIRLGACGGAFQLAADGRLNAHTRVEGGLLEDACAQVLQTFFQARRPSRAERLQRIARLEDVPNIDPALAKWLRTQKFETPTDLARLAEPAGLSACLAAWVGDPSGLARLRAVAHFAGGGPALPWRQFAVKENAP